MSIKIKTISVGCNRRDESSSGSCDPVDHAPNFPKLNRYAIPYAFCSVAIAFCKIRSCYSYIVVLPCFSRVLYAYGQKIPMTCRISFRLESSRENRNIESSTVRSRVTGKRFGRPLRKTASCETSLLCYLVRLFVRSSIKIARYLSCKNDESPSKIGKLFAPASRSRTPAAFNPPRKFNEVQTEQNESVVLRAGTFVRKRKGWFSARSAI